jgi:gamma-D-glutamyl-L-lysine dipeptidyl-peptidase
MTGSICPFGVIPLRNEPSERAELDSQILFGEVFWVVEVLAGWCRVRCDFDGHEGWVDEKLVISSSQREIEMWQTRDGVVVQSPFIKLIREPYKSGQLVSAGSRIVFNGEDRNSFMIGKREYYLQSALSDRKPDLEEVAKGFLNAPYLWGGRNFFGIDCSGLSQVVFKIMGHKLPRNATQQMECGTMVSFVEEARPGDLAFFDNEEGEIVHVGICLGSGRIIHASGEVRMDHLDHQGIFSRERQKYTHHLRVIKRIID